MPKVGNKYFGYDIAGIQEAILHGEKTGQPVEVHYDEEAMSEQTETLQEAGRQSSDWNIAGQRITSKQYLKGAKGPQKKKANKKKKSKGGGGKVKSSKY